MVLGALATWLSCSDASTAGSTADQPEDADAPDNDPSSDTLLNTLTPEEFGQICHSTLGSKEFETVACMSSALSLARIESNSEAEFRQVCTQRLGECLEEINFGRTCDGVGGMANPDCEATVGDYRACTELQIVYITGLGGCDGDYEDLLQFMHPSFEACTVLETCY